MSYQHEENGGHRKWDIGVWSYLAVTKMLQYLYELDYQVDRQEGTAPDLSIHVDLWRIGQYLGIKGLKVVAADRFKYDLALFNVYGSEVDFKISYFVDLMSVVVEDVWVEHLTISPGEFFRNQVSMHLQQNIRECAKKEGARSRFLESMYRLIFRETELQNPDFLPIIDIIRIKSLESLDTEIRNEVVMESSNSTPKKRKVFSTL